MQRSLPKDWRELYLSHNFQFGEFVVSKDHPELIKDYTPTIEQATNSSILCRTALQKARDNFGAIEITSGIVTPELNAARGSKITDSQHLYGEAADFILLQDYTAKAYLWLKDYLKWPGELIYYEKRGHIHIGLPVIWVHPDHKVDPN